MIDPAHPWPLVANHRAERLPADVARALTLVLADMQRPRAVDIAVGWTSSGGPERPMMLIEEQASGCHFGFTIDVGEHEELVEQIAHQLQDQFFSETATAWAEPRPRCPGHPHPAVVRLIDQEASWVCPSSGRRIARVGEFVT